MARFKGTISITGLPPHRGLIVNLCFFEVTGHDAPPPYNGDPPAEAAIDCDKIFDQVHLDKESQDTMFEHHFDIERSHGDCYVQLRVILFRTQNEKVFAQVERFFFGRQPVRITAEAEGTVTLPISWPTLPLEAMHRYGTFRPQVKRPWWRFW